MRQWRGMSFSFHSSSLSPSFPLSLPLSLSVFLFNQPADLCVESTIIGTSVSEPLLWTLLRLHLCIRRRHANWPRATRKRKAGSFRIQATLNQQHSLRSYGVQSCAAQNIATTRLQDKVRKPCTHLRCR